MDDRKRFFTLHTGIHEFVNELDNNDAGELFKIILKHAKGDNTDTENQIAKVCFLQLKGEIKFTRDDVMTTTKGEIEVRKREFAETLTPYCEKYGRDMLIKFYEYWTEDMKGGKRFRQEGEKTWDIEKRLKRWFDNDKSKPNTTPAQGEEKFIGRQTQETVFNNIKGW